MTRIVGVSGKAVVVAEVGDGKTVVLRAYGNAIVPQVAAAFIRAAM